MISRWRPYLLGFLGLAAITFPFLWLQLAPNFTHNTVTVAWAPGHGLQFFSDLSLVFILALLIWLGLQSSRRFGWGQALWMMLFGTIGLTQGLALWGLVNRDLVLWLFLLGIPTLVPVSLGIWANRRFGWGQALSEHRFSKQAVRHWQLYWAWATMALVLASPGFLSPSGLSLLTYVGIYMLLALGLNITVGMTGLLVLGYAGFYGFGAYFFALMQQNLPWFSWWLAAPLAFFFGGAAGYLLGLPCLRLRGDYLAIVTLGFAEAFRELMRNLAYDPADTTPHSAWVRQFLVIFNTGGDQGISLNGKFGRVAGLSSDQVAYIVTALVLFLAVFLVQRLFHSPVGRAWIAIRENEIAAAAVGVPVVQMKLLAFSLSAAVAAVAGVIAGAKDGFVSPTLCEFQQSIMVLAMVILGGLGNSYGALLGAALLYLVPEYLKFLPSMINGSPALSAIVPSFVRDSLQHLSDYRLLLFGAVMVLMMLYRPQGLLGSRSRKTEMQHA